MNGSRGILSGKRQRQLAASLAFGQDEAEPIRRDLVDRPVGELPASDEIASLFHDNSHLFQLLTAQGSIAAGGHDQRRRLHPDTGHAQQPLLFSD